MPGSPPGGHRCSRQSVACADLGTIGDLGHYADPAGVSELDIGRAIPGALREVRYPLRSTGAVSQLDGLPTIAVVAATDGAHRSSSMPGP